MNWRVIITRILLGFDIFFLITVIILAIYATFIIVPHLS